MSPADRRNLDALLYLPSDDLVRATIEGDDSDWSEAVGYVPSELLVAGVLQSPSTSVPSFRFPPWMTMERQVKRRGVRRVAAGLLAALGLSPSSLAASTVVHIVVIAAIGPWIADSMGGVWSLRRARPAVPLPTEAVVYVSPIHKRYEPPPTAAPRRPAAPRVDSAAIRAQQEALEREQRLAHEEDVRRAAEMEILLSGDLRIEEGSGRDVEQLLRLLQTEPWLRIRIVGRGTRRERAGEAGALEAETMKRVFVNAGVAAERIELAVEPACGEREPMCGASRSLVRVVPLPRGDARP